MTFQTFDRSDVVTWPDKKKPTNLYFSRIYVFRLPFHWIQCACKDLIICRGLRKDNKIHNHKAERFRQLAPKFLLLTRLLQPLLRQELVLGPAQKLQKNYFSQKITPWTFLFAFWAGVKPVGTQSQLCRRRRNKLLVCSYCTSHTLSISWTQKLFKLLALKNATQLISSEHLPVFVPARFVIAFVLDSWSRSKIEKLLK